MKKIAQLVFTLFFVINAPSLEASSSYLSPTRLKRNEIFVAATKDSVEKFMNYSNNLKRFKYLVLDRKSENDPIKAPAYDAFGLHLLTILALHNPDPRYMEIGLRIFEACELSVDTPEKTGDMTALHYVLDKGHDQVALTLLKAGANPFLSVANPRLFMDNNPRCSFEAILFADRLGKASSLRPWLTSNRKRAELFTKTPRYALWHKLLSSYNLLTLYEQIENEYGETTSRIEKILTTIYAQDDVCALLALVFWLKDDDLKKILPPSPAAIHCKTLLNSEKKLAQAKELYRKQVVLPQFAAQHLVRRTSNKPTNNILRLLTEQALFQ